jgi:uncharacterized protein (DUF305 family)
MHQTIYGISGGFAKLRLSFLLAIGVIALSIILSGSAAARPATQAEHDMEHMQGLSGKEFEIHWLSMMIEHHQSAIDMSMLAAGNAQHQEVKDLAQKIIADQTREITDMTGWLQQWHNTAPMKGMMHEMPGMGMAEMMNLKNLKGDNFDRQFLTMMRMHHMGAVHMAEMVPSRATHSELKTLGQNIITSQSAEIKQMEGWLKVWYNLDVTGNPMSGGMMGGNSPGMPRTGSSTGTWLIPSLLTLLLSGAALLGGAWLRKRTAVLDS